LIPASYPSDEDDNLEVAALDGRAVGLAYASRLLSAGSAWERDAIAADVLAMMERLKDTKPTPARSAWIRAFNAVPEEMKPYTAELQLLAAAKQFKTLAGGCSTVAIGAIVVGSSIFLAAKYIM
jgi:hypothetical protein